jgi:translation initiation factor eIF-2B subunit delta
LSSQAKDDLCQKIDNYIRDRIIFADEVIQELAGKKINDGDAILTYARLVFTLICCLFTAYLIVLLGLRLWRRFYCMHMRKEKGFLLLSSIHGLYLKVTTTSVEYRIDTQGAAVSIGKALLKRLTSVFPPIPCTYALLPALPSLITEVTTVLLGAHSLNANGSVYSRAGTAMVAMLAKTHSVPVMVCCETYKFSEGVMLDGFGKNELGDALKPVCLLWLINRRLNSTSEGFEVNQEIANIDAIAQS